jgi:hypothetical protein
MEEEQPISLVNLIAGLIIAPIIIIPLIVCFIIAFVVWLIKPDVFKRNYKDED